MTCRAQFLILRCPPYLKRYARVEWVVLDLHETPSLEHSHGFPDFGVTPEGPKYSRGRDISAGIGDFNRIVTEEARKRGLRVVDLFERSKQMAIDRSLVAADRLHPSGKEYAEWENLIYPAAVDLLHK